METNTYEHKIDINSCDCLSPIFLDIGSAIAASSDYPEFTLISSFERYSGGNIYCGWCPKEETPMAQLLAYASAVRWDAEYYRSFPTI